MREFTDWIKGRWGKAVKKTAAAVCALCLCMPQTVYGRPAVSSGNSIQIKDIPPAVSDSKNTNKVSFYRKNGTLYKTVSVDKEGYIILPGIKNTSACTFMGWSDKPGQTKAPKYETGQRIRINGNHKLYAVMFRRNREPDLKENQLEKVNLSKYRKVIFVGDSRTRGMEKTFLVDFEKVPKGVSMIARGGQGLYWLKQTAVQRLFAEVRCPASEKRPAAVIFNLGANDLSYCNAYITYMNQLAEKLKARGCKLFYMSVNPMNNAMRRSVYKNETKIRDFNNKLKAGLSDSFTYIDTYRFLMRTGYSTLGGVGKTVRYDDGLHYDSTTYKRIYNQCIKKINGK